MWRAPFAASMSAHRATPWRRMAVSPGSRPLVALLSPLLVLSLVERSVAHVCKGAKILTAGQNPWEQPAEFWLDGAKVPFVSGDGVNVVTIDPVSQLVTNKNSYNLGRAPGGEEDSFLAQDLEALAPGTIVLVATTGVHLLELNADALRALEDVGAPTLEEAGLQKGLAFIGAKRGAQSDNELEQSVHFKFGFRAEVTGDVPCLEGIPQQLRPTSAFPGQTAEESNKAWPLGRQPETLEAWPKEESNGEGLHELFESSVGRLKPCWEVHVLRDTADGWPGLCSGLKAQNVEDAPAPKPVLPPKAPAEAVGGTLAGCDNRSLLVIDSLARSNLGGLGPDFGDKTLVFEDVFPYSGSHISMVVTAQDSYKPERSAVNGLAGGGKSAFISVAAGTKADLLFKFVDTMTQKPVSVGPFYVTFLDLDVSTRGITTSGFIAHNFGSNTQVTAEKAAPNQTTFAACGPTGKVVIDPEHLTPAQEARAVSVLYPASDKFSVQVQRVPSASPGGLIFSGAVDFTCPALEVTSRRLKGVTSLELTQDGCRSSCQEDPTCAVWSFHHHYGCFQGDGRHCYDGGDTDHSVAGAQRLQHGRIRVLMDISKIEIVGLYQLGKFAEGNREEGIRRCKEWCYSEVTCQYWQFGTSGCFVEAPRLQETQVQYPLTLKGGASRTSHLARSFFAGEYIQHYCPPNPGNSDGVTVIDVSTGRKSVESDYGFPTRSWSWWLDQVPAANWPRDSKETSQAAWTHGRQPPPLAAWAKNENGDPFPCAQVTILADTKAGWPGKCTGLQQRTNAFSSEDCMLSCVFIPACSVWQFTEDGKCFQGSGDKCYGGTKESLHVEVRAAQRLQHGQVRILKDIHGLEIANLYNLGVLSEGDEEEDVERCKRWCYSDIDCEYWEYGEKGCWVNAKVGTDAYKKVQYPLTLRSKSNPHGGATSDSDFARQVRAGEYIQHYCASEYLVRNYSGSWHDYEVDAITEAENEDVGRKKGKEDLEKEMAVEKQLEALRKKRKEAMEAAEQQALDLNEMLDELTTEELLRLAMRLGFKQEEGRDESRTTLLLWIEETLAKTHKAMSLNQLLNKMTKQDLELIATRLGFEVEQVGVESRNSLLTWIEEELIKKGRTQALLKEEDAEAWCLHRLMTDMTKEELERLAMHLGLPAEKAHSDSSNELLAWIEGKLEDMKRAEALTITKPFTTMTKEELGSVATRLGFDPEQVGVQSRRSLLEWIDTYLKEARKAQALTVPKILNALSKEELVVTATHSGLKAEQANGESRSSLSTWIEARLKELAKAALGEDKSSKANNMGGNKVSSNGGNEVPIYVLLLRAMSEKELQIMAPRLGLERENEDTESRSTLLKWMEGELEKCGKAEAWILDAMYAEITDEELRRIAARLGMKPSQTKTQSRSSLLVWIEEKLKEEEVPIFAMLLKEMPEEEVQRMPARLGLHPDKEILESPPILVKWMEEELEKKGESEASIFAAVCAKMTEEDMRRMAVRLGMEPKQAATESRSDLLVWIEERLKEKQERGISGKEQVGEDQASIFAMILDEMSDEELRRAAVRLGVEADRVSKLESRSSLVSSIEEQLKTTDRKQATIIAVLLSEMETDELQHLATGLGFQKTREGPEPRDELISWIERKFADEAAEAYDCFDDRDKVTTWPQDRLTWCCINMMKGCSELALFSHKLHAAKETMNKAAAWKAEQEILRHQVDEGSQSTAHSAAMAQMRTEESRASDKESGELKTEIDELWELLLLLEWYENGHGGSPEDKAKLKRRMDHIRAELGGGFEDRGTEGDDEDHWLEYLEGLPRWVLYLLLFLLLLPLLICLLMCLNKIYKQRVAKRDAENRTLALDVFRLSATKDRYDYYEAGDNGYSNGRVDEVTPLTVMSTPRYSELSRGRQVVIVLEKADLEAARSFPDKKAPMHSVETELLSLHESLIACLDSPLNKAGMLMIFIHSKKDVLVRVHPAIRIPRMFPNFALLCYELLRRGVVRGANMSEPLMEVIQGPVDRYLPPNTQRYGLSPSGKQGSLRDVAKNVDAAPNGSSSTQRTPRGQDKRMSGSSVVFAIGTSMGDVLNEEKFGRSYLKDYVSICPWGLRAPCVCQMVTHEFENAWGLLESNQGPMPRLIEEVAAQLPLVGVELYH